MTAPKRSVDDIWKELNAKQAPRLGVAHLFGMPGVKTQTVPSKAVVQQADTQPGKKATAYYDPEKAGVSGEEVQQYMAAIQRTVNCLSDPDRSTRRQAIQTLRTRLIKGDSTVSAAAPSLLQALLYGPLLYPVTGLIHDPVEKCRSEAVGLLADAVPVLMDVEPLLPALMPEVSKAMGQLPVAETSEEIRLQLVGLIANVLARMDRRLAAAYADELATFVQRSQEDAYYEIKKAGAVVAVTAASKLPQDLLLARAERIVTALLANLSHQHSRVRLAMVQALHAVVAAGLPPGLLAGTVAPGVRATTLDRAANVREALFEAMAHWLGADAAQSQAEVTAGSTAPPTEPLAPTRLSQEYAPALLPLLLLGLTDPQDSVRARAVQLVEGVGEAWLTATSSQPGSNGTGPQADAGEARSMDTDEHGSAAGPEVEMQSSASGKQEELQDGKEEEEPSTSGSGGLADEQALAAALLRPPFTGRPTAGARRMVSQLLKLLLPGLLKELGEWTVTLRSSAARSLHATLVLAEGSITAHLPSIMPVLCTAIGDEDAVVAGHIMGCVHVLGIYTAASCWLPLALDHLALARLAPSQRASTLVLLSGLLHSAGRSRQHLDDLLLDALAKALTAEELRGSEHPAVRKQLLSVTLNTMRWVHARCSAVSLSLYSVLLQLYGLEQEPAQVAAVQSALQELASHCGEASAQALAERHAALVLEDASRQHSSWEGSTPAFTMFRALLRTSGPQTLSAFMPQISSIMRACLEDAERDAPLRLGLLQLVDELMESPGQGEAFGGQHAERTLRDVLLPPLVWRAGKVAAAVRFSAITALATFLRRQLAPTQAVMAVIVDGTLLPLLFQSLEEDWYVDVRNVSCYVMERLLAEVGPALDDAQRRSIYPELLKRLDDSSNQVRIAACGALCTLAKTLPSDYCETNAGYLAAGMLIHMDDSDAAVQGAAAAAMEALAAVKPAAVAKEVQKAQDKFRCKHMCERVLAACQR